uniref:Uncharacterized protein n=1 Tax=Amphimedon queenslandica TaxID=400682 RepID=A0A1X7UGM1_AMPQE
MIDLCQWRARIGSWNCSRHWRQPSTSTSTSSNTYCGTGRASASNTAQEKGPRLVLSIFCLLILLLISGDVELNPGPTLTDKPTKDELVELLSSSKFTAGTWEQFVCYLPNVTQEVISNINQKEEVEDAEHIDSVSAVAQCCLDNNSEITWKIIVMSLLDAKECILTKQILTKIECSCVARKRTKVDATVTVETTLRKHFAFLFRATEDCLESVTVEFFSKGLISRDVRKSPSFCKIENEFVASSSCEEDMTKLEEKCRNFVHCLAKAGGPAKDAAIALAEDWERDVLKEHNLRWSLMIDIKTLTDLFLPSEIPLSSEVPQKVKELRKSFLSVMKHIRSYYNDCKQYNVEDFARYLTDDYEVPLTEEPLTNCKSLDSLLYSVKSHYSFFKFDLIEDLVNEFPLSDELQLELDQYVQELKLFKKSTALQQMKDAIKQVPIPHETSEAHSRIVIKLTGCWSDKTVESLENLIQYLFKRDSKRAKLIEIDEGSIVVTFLAFSTSQSLIDKVQDKSQFVQYLGIFEIIINDDIVIKREEDVNFKFEDSLLHAINHIDKLKIKLNYQNTDGQTALMLASQGGHIEIFKSLLQNRANPFVQLPANKGFIGLNSLACTALSQHIYKSIGGKRIIPRDDTSIEEVLEMAVKERGVSRSSYSSFVHGHLSYLRAKFRWVQNCFHALNSSFIDAATNILTSKALVTEAKQIFQLYIKEDATCENANQLVQLLQSHYSCLNINLLTIPCTITEPIKEQVEEYNTNLKMFKDTTSLLELAVMTKGMQYPDGVGCSKLIVRLNKPWCSRKITELNKMEVFYLSPISSFLNLIQTHYDASSCTCTYFLPHLSQIEPLMEAFFEQGASLYKIGVFEVMIDDIPIIMKDEDSSFTFEAALQEAYKTNDEKVLFFLTELNISLPLENDNTALLIASKKEDSSALDAIKALVDLFSEVLNINIQNDEGLTLLMIFSRNGYHQVVELLLNKNPDINIQDKDGWTALMYASTNGHHQVVELLLSKNPDINIQNNNGGTALMFASANRHHQVVELLLSKDPDINIQDNNRTTALMLASLVGHHQVVQLLLSKDPDINIQNKDGWTALMYASTNGHHQVVELLLSKNPDINIQNNNGGTALMFASANRHHQVVELLLSKDPDINIQDNDGWTALMLASLVGHHQVVQLLLSKDPDINFQNNDGGTALMAASEAGHHQVVELLLSKDPDINIQDIIYGRTALILASNKGHHQVVELLLSKNPDINIRNNDGWTALIYACRNGHHQVVELLLHKNPDINSQNSGTSLITIYIVCSDFTIVGFTSPDECARLLDQFSSSNFITILELLLDYHPNHIHTIDGKEYHSLGVAALFNNFDAVAVCMKKCDITPEDIISAISLACNGGHSSMIMHLSEKISTLSNNERKSLVAAAEGDLGTLISMIYEVGMSPDTPLVAGITPLMIAASCGHIELVDTLIQAGADVNKRNDEGLNALDVVSGNMFYDRSDIKQLLITNTPAGEPDPVSNNAESTNKKHSAVTAIKSIFGLFSSFMKKAYDPYYSKQKELKIPSEYTKFSSDK